MSSCVLIVEGGQLIALTFDCNSHNNRFLTSLKLYLVGRPNAAHGNVSIKKLNFSSKLARNMPLLLLHINSWLKIESSNSISSIDFISNGFVSLTTRFLTIDQILTVLLSR